MPMTRGPKTSPGERPSIKYPGFIERADGSFKIHQHGQKGKPNNGYYLDVACSHCGKQFLQLRTNVRRQKLFSCSPQCLKKLRSAPDGRKKPKRGLSGGHTLIKAADHPKARKGFIAEHRLIVESRIGRYLTDEEVVHHVNMIEDDNRIDNLVLMPSQKEHFLAHGSINECVSDLMQMGVLNFDVRSNRYTVVRKP